MAIEIERKFLVADTAFLAGLEGERLVQGYVAGTERATVRVRRCGDPRCSRVFFDATRNGRRRWCDMATCGNRAKAARFRERERQGDELPRAGNGDAHGDPSQA